MILCPDTADCGAGSSWDEDSVSCVPCTIYEYQPQPYQTSCLPCSNGTLNEPGGVETCVGKKVLSIYL